MRARGAKVTDIAAIVVAADDGVMPQTVEAIDHAKAAGVPIVIVVNKIDKPEANIERVKQQLTEHGIVPEEWGGDTVFVEASAKKRIGIDNFLDMLLLVAEVADLKANPDAPASGFVIESKVDPGRGVVATMLVQPRHPPRRRRRRRRRGQRPRARHARLPRRAAQGGGPSTPVEIIGFDELPMAGEFCRVVKDERMARALASGAPTASRPRRSPSSTPSRSTTSSRASPRARSSTSTWSSRPTCRAASRRSSDALLKIQHPEVKVRIIHSGVGGINESDVMLASASTAIIIGFNVRPSPQAHGARRDRRASTSAPTASSTRSPRTSPPPWSACSSRPSRRSCSGRPRCARRSRPPSWAPSPAAWSRTARSPATPSVRVLRNDVVVHDGKMGSLKRFAEDAREVAEGFECGILLDGFNDLKEGDVLEAYETREVAREA